MTGHPTHGHKPKNGKPSQEYVAWCGMKARCHNSSNPKYPIYGGRGIKVCERWRNDFTAFLHDMGLKPLPTLSLERKDVNGDYEPQNCEWATKTTQSRNRRNMPRYHFRGEDLLVCEIAERTGIHQPLLLARLAQRWPVEMAATSPRGTRRPTYRPER